MRYEEDTETEIDRLSVGLIVYPKHLGADFITSMLDLQPTAAYNKGDKILTKLGKVATRANSLWKFDSELAVSSKDIRVHLDWFLEHVYPKRFVIHELLTEHQLLAHVNVSWWLKVGGGGFSLLNDQMEKISALKLNMDFNIQFYSDEF